jgi:RNA polymerase sigma-70 factor, ECF subfamily
VSDADDRILVARFLARRDEAAFRALYRTHTPFLYRFLLSLAGGTGEAEELVQEAWVRAAERIEGFAWRSSLKTWLAGIALNAWREHVRAPRGAPLEVEELPAAPAIEREIASIDLARALAGLAPGYREAILLHDVEGYTHEEVAALTGVDAGTSKSQLSRARRALRARLSGRNA